MQWFDELRWRSARWGPLLHEAVQEAVAFDISAIRRYIDPHVRPGAPLLHEDDFRRSLPNCAPLAPATYMEWHEPAQPGRRLAAIMPAWLQGEHRQDGWTIGCFVVSRQEEPAGFAYATACILARISADGSISALDLAKLTADRRYLEPMTKQDVQDMGNVFSLLDASAYLGLTAICFAHCKGVTVTDRRPPRQQRRAAERAGRPPLVTYKTIDIAPVTRILHDEGRIEKTGIKQALHICRGHFAHYSDDAPLFGKYTGTFYKPMHVRGTLERGAVVKDYRVLPGDENAGPPSLSHD